VNYCLRHITKLYLLDSVNKTTLCFKRLKISDILYSEPHNNTGDLENCRKCQQEGGGGSNRYKLPGRRLYYVAYALSFSVVSLFVDCAI
jgi:hypothetical protein